MVRGHVLGKTAVLLLEQNEFTENDFFFIVKRKTLTKRYCRLSYGEVPFHRISSFKFCILSISEKCTGGTWVNCV